MKAFLQELLDYSFLMNREIAQTCIDNENNVSPNQIKLFSHILNAQDIWNRRITGIDPNLDVWDIHVLPAWIELNKSLYRETSNILEKEDLNRVFAYSNTKGDSFRNKVSDAIFHIINHSTYHRGQMAVEMRNSGIEPVISDIIYHKRLK